MKVIVTGATGFVGKAVVQALLKQNDEVVIISRSHPSNPSMPKQVQTYTWEQVEDNPRQLSGADAVINLAGESINQRWTNKAKDTIMQSREKVARRLSNAFTTIGESPRVLVNASGMSIYGTSTSKRFDEQSPAVTKDFLASVVERWEKAAKTIPAQRRIYLRLGLVIEKSGGAYPKMTMPYRFGVGGKVGSGKQWISWIHLDDLVRLILFCINNEHIEGAVNGTAPNPVTNDEFGRTLSSVIRRPHWFPVPSFVMKVVFGELSLLLLEGQRVIPQKSLDAGFKFIYPDCKSALRAIEKKD